MKVNLNVLVDEFIAECQQERKPKTVLYYSHNLNLYLSWVKDREWWKEETIRDFLASERARKMSAYTLLARYSSLAALFMWAMKRKKSKLPDDFVDPMTWIKRPDVSGVAKRRANREHVLAVINSIGFAGHWFDQRDRAILRLMLDCGLRIGEVEKLLVSDVNLSGETIMVPALKFGGAHEVPLLEFTCHELREWIRMRPDVKGVHALFLSYNGHSSAGGPLRQAGIRQMFKRRCQAAGVRYFNPHSVRHCYATHLINRGCRIEVLSKLMGHKDIKTTLDTYAEIMPSAVMAEVRALLAD